jgi:hypothetical protein
MLQKKVTIPKHWEVVWLTTKNMSLWKSLRIKSLPKTTPYHVVEKQIENLAASLEEGAAKYDQIVETVLSLPVDQYDGLAFVELQPKILQHRIHSSTNFHATIEDPSNTAYFRKILYITQEQSLYNTCYF